MFEFLVVDDLIVGLPEPRSGEAGAVRRESSVVVAHDRDAWRGLKPAAGSPGDSRGWSRWHWQAAELCVSPSQQTVSECEEVLVERFGRCLVAERLAGAAVERGGDGVEIARGVLAEVGALGEVLAQQAIGVLVGAALPRAVRVAEVHG